MSTVEAAAKYLNNLLLARGLLQYGNSIDFARSAQHPDGNDATTSKIINLVHELLLRRDRDAEHNETLLESMKNLRSAEAQRSLELQQIQDKYQQKKNDLVTAQAQFRSNSVTVKKMEHQIKELREQNLRMKSMLDQVRAKCVNDVRKRDMEIDKLKCHLTGLQRGKSHAGGMRINTLNIQPVVNGQERRAGADVNSTEWGLEKETNDFLAALVQETSAENVALRQVVDTTVDTLKDMTSYEEKKDTEVDDGIGIPGQYRPSRHTNVQALVPINELSAQVQEVLQHCRTILKDPSFVPIEEVQARDEEIIKLRAGWDRMADRWKEAVTMMEQWKQHIAEDGTEIDMGKLSDLSFGRSVAVRSDGRPVLDPKNQLSFVFEESEIELESTQLVRTDEFPDAESDLELEPGFTEKRIISSPPKRGVRLARSDHPLRETNGNSTVMSTSPFDDSGFKDDQTKISRKRKQTPSATDSSRRLSRRRNVTNV